MSCVDWFPCLPKGRGFTKIGWLVALFPDVWPMNCQTMSVISLPAGFTAHVANIGIKDSSTDFLVIAADQTVPGTGVFTQSRFAGPSVTLSRRAVADGQLAAFAVISKNANVANGKAGADDADEIAKSIARVIGCQPHDVLLASTGVIGRRYPMERIRDHIATMHMPFTNTDATECATAIMTTDTKVKVAQAFVGNSSIVGIAKGVGMIEPDMATLITLFMTDARLSPGELRPMFKHVMDNTFNCVSIDTDTSTSDTAAIMASGVAGSVDRTAFAAALEAVALSLTKQIAKDGEGATKLITVTVDYARDAEQAKTVAKAIVNSPLVKTAVHGADPNWGRVAMAIGKCQQYTDVSPDRVVIRFGDQEVYPTQVDAAGLAHLGNAMRADEVKIHVSLNTGNDRVTVYGCDLSADYVKINGEYTT
jgi:glutamate N-acetyltransferase / amino-acid N-acetyltransferase